MILPHFALANPFWLRLLLDADPFCNENALEISGYPEYSGDIGKLPADDQQRMNLLAQTIVTSWSTNRPIISFQVIGHADVALKEWVGTRAQKEQEVSERRADVGFSHLLQLIDDIQPRGPQIALDLLKSSTAKGVGSRDPRIRGAFTPEQMN